MNEDSVDAVLPACQGPSLHCEACGSRDQLAVVVRETKFGLACVTVCPRCALVRPHPLTVSGAQTFALDHARHVTQEKDRQAGST